MCDCSGKVLNMLGMLYMIANITIVSTQIRYIIFVSEEVR